MKEKPKDEDGSVWTKLAEFYKFSSIQILKKQKKIELVFIEVQKLRYYIEEEFIVKKLAKKQNKTMKRLLKEERKNITLINDQILLNKHAFMIIESQNRFFENLGLWFNYIKPLSS